MGLNVRARFFKATYFAAAIIATGGWIWLLYTSLKWAIVALAATYYFFDGR